MVGMLTHKFRKSIAWAALGEGARGLRIRNEDFLCGTKYLARLSHEMHAAHYNDVGLGLCSLLSQRETVANEVGNVLDGTLRIIVREDYGTLRLCQAANV